jgi:carbon-monoxide dehydrogenase iron sulfur subunit
MKRIMIEIDKCNGCKNCNVACMQAHREDDGNIYTLNFSDPRSESRNFILSGNAGKYVPIFCRHCYEPECVKSCMSGALTKDPESGHVLYDDKRCGACFMCVMNCPFGVPKPDRATRSKVIWCDFCKNDEEGPNCVRMCPNKAIRVEEVVLP